MLARLGSKALALGVLQKLKLWTPKIHQNQKNHGAI
jgi:hypothetical protein